MGKVQKVYDKNSLVKEFSDVHSKAELPCLDMG
jgi:hypothetical protein